jgi:hypothetical protein
MARMPAPTPFLIPHATRVANSSRCGPYPSRAYSACLDPCPACFCISVVVCCWLSAGDCCAPQTDTPTEHSKISDKRPRTFALPSDRRRTAPPTGRTSTRIASSETSPDDRKAEYKEMYQSLPFSRGLLKHPITTNQRTGRTIVLA